jgi:hypothetical protein
MKVDGDRLCTVAIFATAVRRARQSGRQFVAVALLYMAHVSSGSLSTQTWSANRVLHESSDGSWLVAGPCRIAGHGLQRSTAAARRQLGFPISLRKQMAQLPHTRRSRLTPIWHRSPSEIAWTVTLPVISARTCEGSQSLSKPSVQSRLSWSNRSRRSYGHFVRRQGWSLARRNLARRRSTRDRRRGLKESSSEGPGIMGS